MIVSTLSPKSPKKSKDFGWRAKHLSSIFGGKVTKNFLTIQIFDRGDHYVTAECKFLLVGILIFGINFLTL